MADNPYPLAFQLARPVAKGWLDGGDAIATLIVAALRHERLTSRPAPGTFHLLRHLFVQRLEREQSRLAVEAMYQRRERRYG